MEKVQEPPEEKPDQDTEEHDTLADNGEGEDPETMEDENDNGTE